MQEKNTRDTVAKQEYSIFFFGVGAALCKILLYSELFIVISGCALKGHKLTPKLVYFLVL